VEHSNDGPEKPVRPVAGGKDAARLRPDPGPDCLFCSQEYRHGIISEHGTVFAVRDGYPVTEGHLLIIPFAHRADFFDTTPEERRDAEELTDRLAREIRESDPSVTGFNIGMNCGESAGQTIPHAHMHLIPRRDGDTADPKGGVRGVIPGKRSY
jgi:diadenosine tetraphosphate (Ap4A) HIT family hydrolase